MWYGGEKGLMALVGEGKAMRYKQSIFYWTDHFYIKIDNIRLVQGSSTETKKKFNFLKTYVALG